MSCPTYVATTGTLVKPPSNDFESDSTGWTTMAEKVSGITRVTTGGACVGTTFLSLTGSVRSGGWDGPGVDIMPYVTVGHDYVVTLAGRFDPTKAPATMSTMILSVAKTCSDANVAKTYTNIQTGVALTDWVRFAGAVQPTLAGCPSLLKLFVYLESADVNQQCGIQVDDFQLWDVTASTGAGGAGGGGGASGIAGTAGASSLAGSSNGDAGAGSGIAGATAVPEGGAGGASTNDTAGAAGQ